MSSIDDRVVSMKFDNGQFEKGVSQTTGSLAKLKQSLDFSNSKKGMDDLQNSASKFSLGGLSSAVEGVSGKFLALSTVAITALSNITNRAIDTGINLAKSLTIDPIMDGFQEYELKMGSIQTILANTARHGTGLADVTASLDALNEYADKTIYNFGDMTKNIGLFTNAGIKIEDATSMIQGFSNMAAASGTSAQGAAGAAYQLSQALSTGTIRLMDWRSLTNVGMGNKNMQDGLIEIADAMGTLSANSTSATEVQGDFNGSLEKNWLSAEVMSSYLKIMAGDMTEAEQAALGLSDAQIKAFSEQQATAEDAATKVRTFTQLVDTLKEGVGSSWAETMDLLIGDFDQATELWSGVAGELESVIGGMGDARNAMLTEWSNLGGRDVAIEAFKNAWEALGAVITPIKEAFREIFPAKTGQDLYNLTVSIRDFMANLKIGEETAANLKRTFKGLFAGLSIGWQILKGIGSVIVDVLGAIGGQSGGFLEFTGGIGDFLVSIDSMLKSGDGIKNFFDGISDAVTSPLQFLDGLGQSLVSLWQEITGGFTAMVAAFKAGGSDITSSGLAGIMEAMGLSARHLIDWFGKLWQSVKDTFGPIAQFVEDAVSEVGTLVQNMFTSKDISSATQVLNTGLLGGIALAIKKFLSGGLSIDFGGGILESINDTFGALTDTLGAMQAQIQANTLMKIAIAIGILTASVVVLSLIDGGALAKSLGAMSVAFGQLLAAMGILTKISGAAGVLKIPVIAAGMILLAGAILLLTFAVRSLAGLSFEELFKGLLGVVSLLAMVVLVANGLSGVSGQMVRAGLGMILIAVAVKIFASAMKDVGDLDWAEIGKGLAGIAGSLGLIVGAVQLMPPNMAAMGLGIVLIAAAMKILASAISDMASMDWSSLGKGLAGMAGALAAVALGMNLMPKNMAAQAAGLLLISGAVYVISKAISSLGGMSWEEIAKGLVALGGSLAILAGGMKLLSSSSGGALALAGISAALAIFVPILVTLGNLSWGTILSGLGALAATFAVLGLSALALGPVVPILSALGLALLAVSAAFVLFGIGAMAVAKAFEIIAVAGQAGVEVVLSLIGGLISAIPAVIVAVGEGIVGVAGVIATSAPALLGAFVAIIDSLLQAIIDLIPKVAETFTVILQTIVGVILTNAPMLVQAGFDLLISFLKGIANNIGKVVSSAVDVIVNFINGIANNLGKIIQSGFDLAIKFLNGVADGIKNNSSAVVNAALNIGKALVQGIWDGITGLADWLWDQVTGWMEDIWNGILDFFGISSPSKQMAWVAKMMVFGLGGGIDKEGYRAVDSATNMSKNVLDAVTETLGDLPNVMDGLEDPTIKPILDLSNIQSGASKIAGLLESDNLSSSLTLQRANSIANSVDTAADSNTSDSSPVTPVELKFEQNNYSPKALTELEIFRNTKSQLALAKEELGVG